MKTCKWTKKMRTNDRKIILWIEVQCFGSSETIWNESAEKLVLIVKGMLTPNSLYSYKMLIMLPEIIQNIKANFITEIQTQREKKEIPQFMPPSVQSRSSRGFNSIVSV